MTFQEFVNEYYGFPVDLLDLSEEDEDFLMSEYEACYDVIDNKE